MNSMYNLVVHFLFHIFILLDGTYSLCLILHPYILMFYYITVLVLHRKHIDVCSVTVLHTYRSHSISCGKYQVRKLLYYCTYNETFPCTPCILIYALIYLCIHKYTCVYNKTYIRVYYIIMAYTNFRVLKHTLVF